MLRLPAFLLLLSTSLAGAKERVVTIEDLPTDGSPIAIEGYPRDDSLPVVGAEETSPEAGLLRRLVAQGKSTGFDRILYENRDRDHSTLKQQLFPNLTFIEYDPDLVTKTLDYGAARRLLYSGVLLGNSSTAFTKGLFRRSQTRNEMTIPGGAARAYRHYTANSLYIYPEHRDHDAYDLFPMNWPYTVISQGSSGSDRPFLKAIAMTLAAFPPETRARLEQAGLVPATVQMILRRSMNGINTRADYLSGRAHPVAFVGENLRPALMVSTAASLSADEIPPLVQLQVERETFGDKAGLVGLTERLADTPSAVARVFRATRWEHEMILSAAATTDPNGRDLTFDWVLLQGDPALVSIEPLGDNGDRARLRIAWQDAFNAPASEAPLSRARIKSRVDIGVFANNGATDSAPALVSVLFPTHQRRTYAPRAGRKRLLSIDYDADSRADPADPRLFWSAPWRDVYSYDEGGNRTGFLRKTATGDTAFSADGTVLSGGTVTYTVEQRKNAIPLVSYSVDN